MSDKVIDFNKKFNVNDKSEECVNLINELKAYINYGEGLTNIQTSDLTEIDFDDSDEVIENEDEMLIIDTELDLLVFYQRNNENGIVPNKTQTSKMTGLNIEKVRRLNRKLRDNGFIETEGKIIKLTKKGLEV